MNSEPTADSSARAVVERFLAANTVLDVDGMFEEIGPEARWVFPAAPPGAPREVSGKDRNRAFFESLRPMWTAFELTFTDVNALAGGDSRVVAHYASRGTLLDGSQYTNTYLSLVTVKGGEIVEWIEFCDAAPLERGVDVMRAALGLE
jgi:ketosteroid isomerase-like protein